MNLSLVSFVLRAKNRKKILDFLSKETLTPAQLMKRTSMYESHVSRSLRELLEQKLIECENPKERRFRFYKITKLGKEILEESQKIEDEIKEI
ncbi:MAG: winged helix-turn-helix domain-containing protein [Nanoarchaeota archaeon]